MKSVPGIFLQIILLLAIAVVAQIFISCSEEPPVKPLPPPAPPDTTTHEYRWEEILVNGTGEGMDLYDVWAFSPENVWVVGAIRHGGYPAYFQPNVYHWDGKKWEFRSIPIRGFGPDSGAIENHAHLSALWGFSPNDIFFTTEQGGHAYTWMRVRGADTTYDSHYLVQYGLGQGHIWALDSNRIFIGGHNCDALFYDGTTFKPINANLSGFFGEMLDLWAPDPSHVFACLSSTNWPPSPHYFLKFNGIGWETLWRSDTSPSLSDSVYFGLPQAVWGVPGEDSMWVSGLWIGRMKKDGSGKIRAMLKNDKYGAYTIRGTAGNNVFFAGGAGNIIHWNGSTFFQYKDFLGKPYFASKIFMFGDHVYIACNRYSEINAVILHGVKVR